MLMCESTIWTSESIKLLQNDPFRLRARRNRTRTITEQRTQKFLHEKTLWQGKNPWGKWKLISYSWRITIDEPSLCILPLRSSFLFDLLFYKMNLLVSWSHEGG